jgi:hypothetical protein
VRVAELQIDQVIAVNSSAHPHVDTSPYHYHPHPPHRYTHDGHAINACHTSLIAVLCHDSDWHNYRLLHIGDRRLGPIRDVRGTIPVIFLHGHHGSYRSIQAMVSFHADLLGAPDEVRLEQSLEFFTIDYHEGSSAFHGALLWQQVTH